MVARFSAGICFWMPRLLGGRGPWCVATVESWLVLLYSNVCCFFPASASSCSSPLRNSWGEMVAVTTLLVFLLHLCSFAFLVVETNQTYVSKEPVKIASKKRKKQSRSPQRLMAMARSHPRLFSFTALCGSSIGPLVCSVQRSIPDDRPEKGRDVQVPTFIFQYSVSRFVCC